MKFKELRRLIEQYEIVNEGGKGMMVPGLNSQQASDGSVSLHDVTEPEMLERINAGITAFVSNVPSSGIVDPVCESIGIPLVKAIAIVEGLVNAVLRKR